MASKMKTYKLLKHLGLQLHITKKDGTKVPVDFTGGTRAPKIVRGTFQTADPEIQKKLEQHSKYNSYFKIAKEEDVYTSSEVDSEKSKAKDVPGISNVQDAKNYLMNNFDDVKAEDVKSKKKVLEKAEELNLNFPDMNKE